MTYISRHEILQKYADVCNSNNTMKYSSFTCGFGVFFDIVVTSTASAVLPHPSVSALWLSHGKVSRDISGRKLGLLTTLIVFYVHLIDKTNM